MCGIVGYFGGASNSLTRVLTAMSAIIYRAPDSTGIGIFGNENEPLRTRKSVGSVIELSEILLKNPLYPNVAMELVGFFDSAGGSLSLAERQLKLFLFEKLPLDYYTSLVDGEETYPTFRELMDVKSIKSISPGWPGRPQPLPDFAIASPNDLFKYVVKLINDYDLSPVVIQCLIRKALNKTLEKRKQEGFLQVEPQSVLYTFDQLFERALRGEMVPQSKEPGLESLWTDIDVEGHLWRFLRNTTIKIPPDYDPDGVRCIFRLLDSALMSRLPLRPRLREDMQKHMETLWPHAREIYPIDWRMLYCAEKGTNIYGWAAATAMTYLERNVLSVPDKSAVSDSEAMMGHYFVPGRTNAVHLSALVPPILSQGRWALQSAVTVENAHPFFDDQLQRMVVLNGQFNSQVEVDIRQFLDKVGGFSFRSQNSSEYFVLLWGYYFELLSEEKRRYFSIRSQIEKGLENYSIGSQSIDYQVFHKIKDKSTGQVDELAFIEAARHMVYGGGQVAVAGLSLLSPHRLLVASHNRPVFIVRRVKTDEFMVVSDINAAMGLFSQKKIHRITQYLNVKKAQHLDNLMRLKNKGASLNVTNGEIRNYHKKEKKLLSEFSVEVYPLEGKEIFASIVPSIEGSSVKRNITITDFNGNPIPEIESFTTELRPPQIQKDFYTSFYETHLKEIPRRLRDILTFYVPEKKWLPSFNLKNSYLRRRFGEKFGGLKRIVITGMGSAYNMSFAARQFIEAAVPSVEVLTMKPVDVENPMKVIYSEKDLVILLSWSGTTAEIVQFASLLKSYNVAMVVITEKFFSELGLIGEKSGGVISTLTGEEVTVSGVKSTICSLFCLYLFGIWLCSRMVSERDASDLMKPLLEIPDKITQLLENREVENFCKLISQESARSYANFVVDALNTVGTGREVAIKLEETSWSSLGKFLDYRDLYINGLKKDMGENLVLVNATHKPRLNEAIEVMKKLYLKKIPFAAVAIPIREQAQMDMFCNNRCAILPETEPLLQPIIDFTFYYIFSFHYGVAHGRAADFPRNRAKSVTAGRTLWTKQLTPAGEIHLLEEINRKFNGDRPFSIAWSEEETTWEAMASEFSERTHFKEMRRLAKILYTDKPLPKLVRTNGKELNKSIHHLVKAIGEEREIIFIPLDRPARSAAENLKIQWNRLLSSNIRVANRLRISEPKSGSALIFLLASRPTEAAIQKAVYRKLPSGCIYVGPEFSAFEGKVFKHNLSNCFFKKHFSFCEEDLTYVTMSLIFIEGLRKIALRRANIVSSYFRLGAGVIGNILNNGVLKREIDHAMAANKKYKTSIFIGPPGGIGMAWTDRFDQFAGMILQSHFFGDGAHGFLVTVDPRVDRKYIRVAPRNQMIPKYGTDKVRTWEKRFLKGDTTDVFLNRSPAYLTFYPETPFFADGNWYFPILQEDYDISEDNLIMIDATSQRHLAQAQDELATFGCRYARMIVFTQEAFLGGAQEISLFKYPISHLVKIPPLYKNEKEMVPVKGLILPIAMSLLSSAAAGATIRSQMCETVAGTFTKKKGVEIQ